MPAKRMQLRQQLQTNPITRGQKKTGELFSVPAEQLFSLGLLPSFYQEITSVLVPGEYPSLTDQKGTLTGSAWYGGDSLRFRCLKEK